LGAQNLIISSQAQCELILEISSKSVDNFLVILRTNKQTETNAYEIISEHENQFEGWTVCISIR